MATIVRGTTPTIEIAFRTVTPEELDSAILTVQCGELKITRNKDTATAGQKSLLWVLSQEETLSLPVGDTAFATCVWLNNSGVRGQSKTLAAYISDTPINEVMQ